MTENSKSTKPQPAKVEWYYERDGAVVGPITEARLRYAVKYGHVKPDTLIWRTDFDHWLEAIRVPIAAAVMNRAPSSPGIEQTFTSIRLRMEPSKEQEQETPEAPEATETQPQASSPEFDSNAAEALYEAVTDEEAAEPVIDVNMARAIVDRASGRPTASSIAPASVTFRPPPGEIAWLPTILSQRPKLIAIGAASLVVVAVALMVVLRSRPKPEPVFGLTKTSTTLGTEPSVAPSSHVSGVAAIPQPDPISAPAPTGEGLQSGEATAASGVERPSNVTIEGPLDPALFLQYLKRSAPIFEEQCWVVYRVPGVKVESHPAVNIELEIDRTGHVYDARWAKAPKGYRGVGRCIAGRMRGWKFQPADAGTHAVVTVQRAHD